MSEAPGYWMHETSGVLRPAVEAYLAAGPLSLAQIAALRAYFRQWIAAPAFVGPQVEELRMTVKDLDTRHRIEDWLELAYEAGVDPL